MDAFNRRRLVLLSLLLAACLLLSACGQSEPARQLEPVREDGAVQEEAAPQPAAQPEPEPEEPETVPALAEISVEQEPEPEEPEDPAYTVQEDASPVFMPLPTDLLARDSKEPVIEHPNPLTGLELDDPDKQSDRPVAVMLNNIQAALPQFGNSRADVIFEIVAEGGITRMLALYQDVSDVEQIGSIRSTRPYYIDVAQGYDAILIHCGGSTDAYSQMSSRGTDHVDGIYTDAIFWRDQERARTVGSEHSMFTSGALITDYLAQSGFRLTRNGDYDQTFTDQDPIPAGEQALHVLVPISGYKSTGFDYDAQAGQYLVSQFDGPYQDGQDDSQVAVENVLILHTSVSGTGDSYDHMRVTTTGSGSGLYCQGGHWAEITWHRDSLDEPFCYTLADGSALALGRGTTYVCIVSNSCDVEIS